MKILIRKMSSSDNENDYNDLESSNLNLDEPICFVDEIKDEILEPVFFNRLNEHKDFLKKQKKIFKEKLMTKLNEKYGKDYNLKQLKRDDIMIAKNLATTLGTMTDDELNAKLAEIKQEYGLEYTKEELESTDTSVRMTNVSRIRVWDTVKGLALPMLIAAVIVGLYYAIRYRKLYKNAWIIRPVKLAAKLILVLGFVLAILVIARIPVGSYLGTLLIMAFLITMLADNYSCELALEKVKEKEDK